MLNNKFHHHAWFKGEKITVKEFLDYVLSHSDDFTIRNKINTVGNMLITSEVSNVLTDGRYTYELSHEESFYLAEKNEYFKRRCVL